MAPKPFKHVSRIDVHLWDRFIGAAALDPKTGFYAFRNDDKFRSQGIEPAPLQMPTSKDQTFIFPSLQECIYHRLPALLNDSLPDRFGNALIDKALFSLGVTKEAITPLDRLAYLGSRAMGALQFKPPRGEVKNATAIQLRETWLTNHGKPSTAILTGTVDPRDFSTSSASASRPVGRGRKRSSAGTPRPRNFDPDNSTHPQASNTGS
jgi:hypothetical protein